MPVAAPSPRILVIDDDRLVLKSVARVLRGQGFRVIEAQSAIEGQRLAMVEKPDLLLLDVQLPDGSGFRVCGDLRRRQFDAPILMLTGLDDIEDRVRGLESGADDYLPKPFDERELIARVTALLRRRQRNSRRLRLLSFGNVQIDFERGSATVASKPVSLTKTELSLLELLARNEGRPVTRKVILDTIWNYARTPTTRTVDTHVWRLRKKIGDAGKEPRWLKLLSGQGHYLDNFNVEFAETDSSGAP